MLQALKHPITDKMINSVEIYEIFKEWNYERVCAFRYRREDELRDKNICVSSEICRCLMSLTESFRKFVAKI